MADPENAEFQAKLKSLRLMVDVARAAEHAAAAAYLAGATPERKTTWVKTLRDLELAQTAYSEAVLGWITE